MTYIDTNTTSNAINKQSIKRTFKDTYGNGFKSSELQNKSSELPNIKRESIAKFDSSQNQNSSP